MSHIKIKQNRFRTITGCLLILLIVFAKTSTAEEINIKVFQKTEIEKDEILFKDVAEFKGNDLILIDKMKEIIIGNTPLPGMTKRIENDDLWFLLKQNGIDVSKLNLYVPKDAVATRMSIEIIDKDIEKIVLNYIYKKLPWNRDKVNISNIRINNKVVLPKGDISYEVALPKNTELLGNTLLFLKFSVNEQFKKKVWVSVDIEVLTEVVVTKRPLGRNKVITEDDIHLAEMNLAKLPTTVIKNCEEVVGKRVTRMVGLNEILTTDLVELPPLVKRGDIVFIIAESNGLKVTALGQVKEKGRKGQIVKVENIDSNKGIYARVLDSNSVKVDF